MRKTRIIATFGPAVATERKIKNLAAAGVNIFRINCSHGQTEDLKLAAALIRKATAQSPYPVGLLFDISGPKLRLGRFEGQFEIKTGQLLTLVKGVGNPAEYVFSVNHPGIIESIRKGERVFIDDGNLAFKATHVRESSVALRALNPGVISSGKGINLPDSNINIATITPKDHRDLKTAVALGADFIALSFVRSAEDIHTARRLIKKQGGRQEIIAKLEKREAIEQLDEIIPAADGIMLARGDLGVELPPEELPRLSRKIIAKANRHRKPVIMATQMLESMRHSPRATRAEISDVATAVFEYVDAVMLSAETATGSYPLEAVKTMDKVIRTTEAAAQRPALEVDRLEVKSDIPLAVADAVSRSYHYCRSKVIVAFTTSGFTAEMISALFPEQPIVAVTTDERVWRRLVLRRSVYPTRGPQPKSFAGLLKIVTRACQQYRLARRGDKVVITGGVPFGETRLTNMMMIHEL
ncbi:MAG TPA: pyruvate kinase [candidate division Zixibacteria bacterium]|nr:pyruvate kinase [candidate division Zixibacteria bacterium]